MKKLTPIIYKFDDGYAGFIAELPGATGQGKTIEAVLDELRSAVEELIEEYERMNLPVPWQSVIQAEPIQIQV